MSALRTWTTLIENCRPMVAQNSEIGNSGVCRHFQVLEFGNVGIAHLDGNS